MRLSTALLPTRAKPMNRYYVIAAALIAVTATAPAFADNSPPGYHEAMIKGGGQADAVGVVCGKVSEAQADAHKAELKKMFAAKGVPAAKFGALYSSGYNEMKAAAKTNPVQVRQTCSRLAQGRVSG
jgi:hypothetical protein